MGKAILQRTTTMDEPADNDEEYDSDFGEDEFEDEQGTLNFTGFDLIIIQGGPSLMWSFALKSPVWLDQNLIRFFTC